MSFDFQHALFDFPHLVGAAAGAACAWLASRFCDALSGEIEEGVPLSLHVLSVYRSGGPADQASPWGSVAFFAAFGWASAWHDLSAPTVAALSGLAAAAAVIDLRLHVIPEELTWALLFSGLLLGSFAPHAAAGAAGAAAAAACVWLAMAVVGWARRVDTRAGADVAAAAAGGAWVGVSGVGIYLLVAAGVFLSTSILARMRGDAWSPMGPALVVAIPLAPAVAAWIGQGLPPSL